MIDIKMAPYAVLLLRVATGVLFVAHALLKLLVFTPSGTAGYFASLGLPGALAYLVILVELIGGIALVLGFYTRWAAAALVPVLLGAAVFGHGANGWLFSNPGGGWEFPAFWALVMIAIALAGDGTHRIRSSK